MYRQLTADEIAFVREAGPLHLLVGKLPAFGFVPMQLTNATGASFVHARVEQHWNPDARTIRVELTIPVEYDASERILENPIPRGRLLLGPGDSVTTYLTAPHTDDDSDDPDDDGDRCIECNMLTTDQCADCGLPLCADCIDGNDPDGAGLCWRCVEDRNDDDDDDAED